MNRPRTLATALLLLLLIVQAALPTVPGETTGGGTNGGDQSEGKGNGAAPETSEGGGTNDPPGQGAGTGSGNPLWKEVDAGGDDVYESQMDPDISVDGAGNVAMVYLYTGYVDAYNISPAIVFKRFDAAGSVVVNGTFIYSQPNRTTLPCGEPQDPRLLPDGSGGYFVLTLLTFGGQGQGQQQGQGQGQQQGYYYCPYEEYRPFISLALIHIDSTGASLTRSVLWKATNISSWPAEYDAVAKGNALHILLSAPKGYQGSGQWQGYPSYNGSLLYYLKVEDGRAPIVTPYWRGLHDDDPNQVNCVCYYSLRSPSIGVDGSGRVVIAYALQNVVDSWFVRNSSLGLDALGPDGNGTAANPLLTDGILPAWSPDLVVEGSTVHLYWAQTTEKYYYSNSYWSGYLPNNSIFHRPFSSANLQPLAASDTVVGYRNQYNCEVAFPERPTGLVGRGGEFALWNLDFRYDYGCGIGWGQGDGQSQGGGWGGYVPLMGAAKMNGRWGEPGGVVSNAHPDFRATLGGPDNLPYAAYSRPVNWEQGQCQGQGGYWRVYYSYYHPPSSDLGLSAGRVVPASPLSNDTFELRARVTNAGPDASAGFDVVLKVDSVVFSRKSLSLEPDGEENITFALAAREGRMNLLLEILPGLNRDPVATNDTLTIPVSVAGRPDLAVLAFEPFGALFDGGATNISVIVKNLGGAAASGDLVLTVNGTRWSKSLTLDKGGSATARFPWTPPAPGTYPVVAELASVSPWESRTDNNRLEAVLAVAAVNRAPAVTFEDLGGALAGGKPLASGAVVASGNSTDEEPSKLVVQVRLDDGGWSPADGASPWRYGLDTTSLPDGKHALYARAYDGELYSAEAVLEFFSLNSPLTALFAPAGPQRAAPGDELSLSAGIAYSDGFARYAGLDAARLLTVEWSVDGRPSSGELRFTGAGTAVADNSFITDLSSVGSHTVTVSISFWNSTVRHSWEITVVKPNLPPTVASTTPERPALAAPVGESVTLSLCVTDADGDELVYTWFVDDALATTGRGRDNISFLVPTEGRHTVRVVVSDGRDSAEYTWTVDGTRDRPVLYPAVSAAAEEGIGISMAAFMLAAALIAVVVAWRVLVRSGRKG